MKKITSPLIQTRRPLLAVLQFRCPPPAAGTAKPRAQQLTLLLGCFSCSGSKYISADPARSKLFPHVSSSRYSATRDASNLLAHEAALSLGQMQDTHSISALEDVLNNISLHPIVRHEAAESLGTIGLDIVIPLLNNSLALYPTTEVRETCELALSQIEEMKNYMAADSSPFLSLDPDAPVSCSSVKELR